MQEVNIYDIPEAQEDPRMLEMFLKLTEDEYTSIIEELKNDNSLSMNGKAKLLGFVSLMFSRTHDFKAILTNMIQNKNLDFINHLLENKMDRLKYIRSLPVESAVNFLIAFSGGYLYNALTYFNVTLIKSKPDERWATTDNPVSIKCHVENSRIEFMDENTKLYFPISPDYLACFYHPATNIKDSGFELLNTNSVNEITPENFNKTWLAITHRDRITKYMIIPAFYFDEIFKK